MDYKNRNIDLPYLFFKHSRLKPLVIDGALAFCECAAGDCTNILCETSPFDSLETLEMDVFWMNIWCFKFITKKLLKVQRLVIQVKNTVMVDYLSVMPEEVESIIEGLQAFCKSIKGEVSVEFKCQSRQGQGEFFKAINNKID